MGGAKDIMRKRSILLTARLRFSPQIQPIKETAIDNMIEQILFAADSEKGLSGKQIHDAFYSEIGYAISLSDMADSLERLGEKGRIISELQEHQEEEDYYSKVYKLSEDTRRELMDIQRQSERRFNSVVNRLFKNAKEGPSAYAVPFSRFLSLIFSKLGEEYVRVIKGDIKGEEFLSASSISSALEQIKKDFDSIDQALFKSAIITFFQDSDPDYDAIKWNMTQNYFIAKTLGLDPNGLLLSEEVFKNAVFYLDTNLIIPALEPKDRFHKSFLALNKACERLGIKLRVCQISLDELDDWVTYQREILKKVIDQIPDETAPKVRSLFYEIYCERKRSGKPVGFEELFTNFDSPKHTLKNRFKVELEDDIWFNEARNKPEVIRFAETLKSRYLKMRGRSKWTGTALHDAMLLLWLQKLREETDDNIWLITADTSLPGSLPPIPNAHSRSLAITEDAVLQWISPIIAREAEDEFPAIFAEMIKLRLLPQEQVFDLEDFLIFAELQMSCKELPAEDVEECIRYIKVNAPTLDPSNPAGREKLAREIAKFFASPDRKYKQDLQKLEKRLKELEEKIEEFQKGALKSSAQLRVTLTAITFLLLEALAVFLANRYGEGPNLFQKICNLRILWGVVVPGVTILIGRFYIGKERLKALGWPFTKIF